MSNIHFELFKFMNEHGDKTQDVRKSVMTDRENVIKWLETIKHFFGYGLPSTAEMFDSYYGILNDAIAMLKEQEAIEPRRDANCVRMFRCGVCGEYVGFIDSDLGDPNE